MAFWMRWFALIVLLAAEAQADDSVPSPDLMRLPITLSTVESPAESISAELTFTNGYANLRDHRTLSYVDIRGIRAYWFDRRHSSLDVSFEFHASDNDWFICTELRALDREGELLHHTWAVSRGGSAEPGVAPLEFSGLTRLGGHSADFEIPRELVPHVARVDIRFHDLSGRRHRHFPRRPHRCDPRLSPPTEDGSFEISFANPSKLAMDPAEYLVAFELLVFDADGTLVRTDFRVVDPLPSGKRYRFAVRVKPEYFEYSVAGIGFFVRRQGRSKQALQATLTEAHGVTASGCSDGGKLIELPLEGREYFSELPALSAYVR